MAAGATYEPIATTTLTSAASSITFSSISGSYTDLRLVLLPISNSGSSTIGASLRFNSDTATNYSFTVLYGSGTSAASFYYTDNGNIQLDPQNSGASSTVPMLIEVDIFSYAGSTNKTLLSKSASDKNGSGEVGAIVGLWRSTSAITSITLITSSSVNFASGTVATLYGITKA